MQCKRPCIGGRLLQLRHSAPCWCDGSSAGPVETRAPYLPAVLDPDSCRWLACWYQLPPSSRYRQRLGSYGGQDDAASLGP